MPRRASRIGGLLAGLITAQAIASLQVYLSNRAMHDRFEAMTLAGYRHLPGPQLVNTLLEWRPALGGGLFFTLSIGAGITLATLAALWILDAWRSRRSPLIYFFLLLWTALLAAVNANGPAPLPSLYFILIPTAVMLARPRKPAAPVKSGEWRPGIYHLVGIAALALLWSTQAHSGMFTAIRDNLLLTNPVGIKINDYYYTYTHFSAEAISSNQQKMFKSYSLLNHLETADQARLERVLSDHGYLLTAAYGREDLRIRRSEDRLIFMNRQNRLVHASPARDFFEKPATVLKAVSRKSDRNRFFRRTIFFSLLIAFPITLYWLLNGFFRGVLSLFMPHHRAGTASAAICFLVGAALVLPVQSGRGRPIDPGQLPAVLAGGNWREQVAGLKAAAEGRLEIPVSAYRHLMDSPHIPVQYWLARALGHSRRPETYPDLLRLLHAPHPNVVCQALYSLGRRGGTAAVKQILDIVDTSSHWYVQRYALHALRDLGWKHRRST